MRSTEFEFGFESRRQSTVAEHGINYKSQITSTLVVITLQDDSVYLDYTYYINILEDAYYGC